MTSLVFSILDISPRITRDLLSFLERSHDVPLSEATTKVLQENFCEPSDKGFAFRSSGLHLVVSQLNSFCCKSTEQRDILLRKHDKLQSAVDCSTHEVKEQVERVEMIRRQLAEAQKQLASSQQKHRTLVSKEHNCAKEHKICTVKTEELITCRDFYEGELDKTRSVMNQLSSKLKESRDVSCLSQEEVLLFLQELDLPKSIRDSFKE